MMLQAPRTWSRVAQYLRAQQDLIKAQESDANAGAMHAVSKARDALRLASSLERHELRRFWDFEF